MIKKGHRWNEESIKKRSGKNHYKWKGGRKRYWQKKARNLMIKRGFDLKGLQVHHINHNIKDNRLENIKLLTRKEHGKIHGSPKGVKRSEEFKNNLKKIMKGNTRGFKKGMIPWNKGGLNGIL